MGMVPELRIIIGGLINHKMERQSTKDVENKSQCDWVGWFQDVSNSCFFSIPIQNDCPSKSMFLRQVSTTKTRPKPFFVGLLMFALTYCTKPPWSIFPPLEISLISRRASMVAQLRHEREGWGRVTLSVPTCRSKETMKYAWLGRIYIYILLLLLIIIIIIIYYYYYVILDKVI